MRKRIIAIFSIMIMFMVVAVGYAGTTDMSFLALGKKLSEVKKEDQMSKTQTVIFQTSDFQITKEELEQRILLLSMNSDMDEKDISSEAVNQLLERKIMYCKAMNEGYNVSDEEYQDYVLDLKQSINQSENKDEMEKFFEGFGGEDSYFDAMKTSYMESLVIRKYLNNLMEEYAEENNANIDDIEFISQWNEEEEQIKKNQIEAAHISKKSINQLLEYADQIAEK